MQADASRAATPPTGSRASTTRRTTSPPGVNLNVDEAQLNPTLLPPEHLATDRSFGPDPSKVTDLVSTAHLIGSLGQRAANQIAWPASKASATTRRAPPNSAPRSSTPGSHA